MLHSLSVLLGNSNIPDNCPYVAHGHLEEASLKDLAILNMTEEQITRFWSKTTVIEGLVVWIGPLSRGGYGRFSLRHKGRGDAVLAHRVAFYLANGWLPRWPTWTIDHVFPYTHRNHVDMRYLEAVPHGENSRRSPITLASINKRITKCPRGHLLSGSNLSLDSRGGRRCRICIRERQRARYRSIIERSLEETT